MSVLAPELDELLARRTRPATLRKLGEIMGQRELLTSVPNWVWYGAATNEVHALAVTMLDPEAARRANLVLQLFAELAPHFDAEALASIEPPPDVSSIDDHLEQVLRDASKRQRRFQTLDEEYRPWVARAMDQGAAKDDVFHVVAALDNARRQFSVEVFSELVAGLPAAPGDASRKIRAHLVAAQTYQSRRGRPSTAAAYDAIAVLLPLPEGDATEQNSVLSLEHNFTDGTGVRARLSFHPTQAMPYGVVHAPLALHARARTDAAIELRWEIVTPITGAWPAEWPQTSPTHLSLRASDWREHPDGTMFVYSFALCVPLRIPHVESFRLQLRVTSATHSGLDRQLEWPVVSSSMPDIHIEWPDQLNPDFVRNHPIGPQKHHAVLRDRILSGSSFAVLAPLRFGKSTLLAHLHELQRSDPEIVVAAPVSCTGFAKTRGFSFELFWRAISDSLQAATGVGLEASTENLPGPHAFDALRQLARNRKPGAKVVLVLLDEAQALFTRGGDGHQLGDRLKDMADQWWCRPLDNNAVHLVFGFVGLPGMKDRAGANLMGKLRPLSDRTIDESDLNRLILGVTRNCLQTTREARRRIAYLSSNLAIARELVERLQADATLGGRCWVAYGDVRSVEHDLVDRLRRGDDIFEATLREVFNLAETVNQWQPSELFVVAVAFAEARRGGLRRQEQLRTRVCELLQELASTNDNAFRRELVFSQERVDEHIRGLQDTDVLRGADFSSPFVEAWLLGQSPFGSDSSEARPPSESLLGSLEAASFQTLRRPKELERIGDGGQATVYRFTADDHRTLAWREARLQSRADREEYSANLPMLDELRRRVSKREAGFEYVFDLRDVGFWRDDRDGQWYAVQVYGWLDGFDLETRIGKLPPVAVARLGAQLARAVDFVHRADILHRDIRPANIIVREDNLQPTLIDFGLARHATRPMHTQLASPYHPPEVTTGNPRWTRAADVWSLAATLRALQKETRPLLDQAIAAALVEEPAARATADAFATALELVQQELGTQETITRWFGETVTPLLAGAGCETPLRKIADKFRPQFEGCRLGFYPGAALRAIQAADFLNQLLEAWCLNLDGSGIGFGLGAAIRDNARTKKNLVSKSVKFVWRMRTARSHGTLSVSEELSKFGNPTEAQIAEMTIDAARRIGRELGYDNLERIVGVFFAE